MSGTTADSRAHPWELKPGDRVGRWRVVERLGTGSYGVVYRVEDAPGQSHALKVALRPSDARAEREVALLARTEHPHVVRVHDWGSVEGAAGSHLYFVMDWVRGLPLHQWVETVNPPLREVARVASTLALTLDWLHAKGVRHRDLKPEHILIRDSDTEPVLIDFGVGRQEGASTLTSTVVPPGTLSLRSPEAVDFHRMHHGDERARYAFQPTDDLYALGVCLYRALSGYYPFSPDLPGDLLMLAILAHVPLPVNGINPRVPAGFSDVVSRLLEKHPRARPHSGRELHLALEAARLRGEVEAWEARVFAWEEGPTPDDPSERRAARPVWPRGLVTEDGDPRSTGERRALGAVWAAPPGVGPAGLGLPVARLTRPPPPRRPSLAERVWPHVVRLGVALGVVLLVALVAWLATCRGAEAAEGETTAQQEVVIPLRVERAPEVDAGPMTQAEDTFEVKSSEPSIPPAPKRVKTSGLLRSALGAAVVATCVGAGCASAPPRGRAALKQPQPPPQECPPGSLEAMEQDAFHRKGAPGSDVSLIPHEDGPFPAPAREGTAILALERPMETLSQRGTTATGHLSFAEGRVHERFTGGLTGLSALRALNVLDASGVAIQHQPLAARGDAFTVKQLRSYRARRRVLVEFVLESSQSDVSWTAREASLTGSTGETLRILSVWQESPVTDSDSGWVLVEAEADALLSPGPWTLRVSEEGNGRAVVLEGLTFAR
jgi:predicted Ser/Thr protein kinase